jgi:hypothetical protein
MAKNYGKNLWQKFMAKNYGKKIWQKFMAKKYGKNLWQKFMEEKNEKKRDFKNFFIFENFKILKSQFSKKLFETWFFFFHTFLPCIFGFFCHIFCHIFLPYFFANFFNDIFTLYYL